jgi:hypothetical protein
MTRGDEYRVKASDMAARARTETDPFQQAEYERLSLAYLRLADQADKNSYVDGMYERPPQQPQRQVQQQQQQPQPDTVKAVPHWTSPATVSARGSRLCNAPAPI